MNPLSALQFSPSPALGGQLLDAAQKLQPAKIPTAELEKLAPSAPDLIPPISLSPTASASGPASGSFANFLGQMVQEVSARQSVAGEAMNGVLSGQNVPLHQAMIAMEEASISFQLMVEVRNKLLESYQELMRMQV